MKKIFIIALATAASMAAFAQEARPVKPKVGKKIPEFTLPRITHHTSQQASAKDFEGKWLILDFWSLNCSSCIHSFPKMSEMSEALKNELNIVLVGVNTTHQGGKKIEALYETIREKKNLQLIAAYDSVLNKDWRVPSYPHLIIVDPQGVVKHITSGVDLTKERMKTIMSGKKVELSRKDVPKPAFDPYNISKSKVEVLWQSILTKNNGENSGIMMNINEGIQNVEHFGKFKTAGMMLESLYELAYADHVPNYILSASNPNYGKLAIDAVILVKDKTPFEYNPEDVFVSGLYNYSITLPKDQYEKKRIMKIMQDDLQRVFGYKVSFETRKTKVVQLVAKAQAAEKLRSKGDGPYSYKELEQDTQSSRSSFRVENMPINKLIDMLRHAIGSQTLLFNETGIKGNIDLTFTADMTDLKEVQKTLADSGLQLVVVERPVKTMVISDLK